MSKKECKGLFYQKYENNYVSKRGEIVRKIEMRPLKKLSCQGCEKCELDKEFIEFEMDENMDLDIREKDYMPNQIYQLIVSGYHDDWECYFENIGRKV